MFICLLKCELNRLTVKKSFPLRLKPFFTPENYIFEQIDTISRYRVGSNCDNNAFHKYKTFFARAFSSASSQLPILMQDIATITATTNTNK